MKVLSDYYQELDLFYYGNKIDYYWLNDGKECKSYIQETLRRADKNKISVSKLYIRLSDERCRHILSCYVFGTIIYLTNEKIRNAVDSYIGTKNNIDKDNSKTEKFEYLWLLICFYHDFGYAYENGQRRMNENTFRSLLELPSSFDCVPADIYTPELLENYDDFIKCRFAKQHDHGIAGGIKMYKDLSNLLKEKEGDDRFPPYLDIYFSIASWIIACHNMFYIGDNDDNFDCYKCKGLNSLIRNTSDSYPITLNEYPLFFLFSIVDSIEPIKTFNDLSILDKISCDLENMEFNLSGLCSPKREEYKKKICNLEKWLTKVSKKESENIYKIEL